MAMALLWHCYGTAMARWPWHSDGYGTAMALLWHNHGNGTTVAMAQPSLWHCYSYGTMMAMAQ